MSADLKSSERSTHVSKHLLLPLLSCALFLLSACSGLSQPPLDLPRLNQEILRLTNQMRAEKGLDPLTDLPELDRLSEIQSQDMAQRHFFDHRNPDGLDPFGRMQKFEPELFCASSGENIVMHSLDKLDTTAMAELLMKLWHDSPEHYANIISPKFWQLGVAVTQTEDRVYATQTFAAAVVKLESDLPKTVPQGEWLRLRFRYLAPFPREELSVFLKAPDPQARIPAGNNRFYIGKGPLKPTWLDDDHFSVNFPANYGLGNYQVLLGHQDQYYDAPLTFEAVSASQ